MAHCKLLSGRQVYVGRTRPLCDHVDRSGTKLVYAQVQIVACCLAMKELKQAVQLAKHLASAMAMPMASVVPDAAFKRWPKPLHA